MTLLRGAPGEPNRGVPGASGLLGTVVLASSTVPRLAEGSGAAGGKKGATTSAASPSRAVQVWAPSQCSAEARIRPGLSSSSNSMKVFFTVSLRSQGLSVPLTEPDDADEPGERVL